MTLEEILLCYVLWACVFHGAEFHAAASNMIAHRQRESLLAMPFWRRLAYLLVAPALLVPLALYTLLRGARTGGKQ